MKLHISFTKQWGTKTLVAVAFSQCLLACNKDTPDPAAVHLLAVEKTAFYSPEDSGQLNPVSYQNQPFYFAYRSVNTYQYDQQKRLVHRQQTFPDLTDSLYIYTGAWDYAYTGNQLLFTYLNISPKSTSIIPLTDQGFVADGTTYDAEGYAVFKKDETGNDFIYQTVVAGNIIKQVNKTAYGFSTTTFEYELTRPGLPDPFLVERGRPSRNLVTKATSRYESSLGMPPVMPDESVTVYTYSFDPQGLVTQRRAYQESKLSTDPTHLRRELRITDFEYTN